MAEYQRALGIVPIPFIVFFLTLLIIGRLNFFSVNCSMLMAIMALLTLLQYNNYWTILLVGLPCSFLMKEYTLGTQLFTIEELNAFRWILLWIWFGVVIGFMFVTRKESLYERVMWGRRNL